MDKQRKKKGNGDVVKRKLSEADTSFLMKKIPKDSDSVFQFHGHEQSMKSTFLTRESFLFLHFLIPTVSPLYIYIDLQLFYF